MSHILFPRLHYSFLLYLSRPSLDLIACEDAPSDVLVTLTHASLLFQLCLDLYCDFDRERERDFDFDIHREILIYIVLVLLRSQ